MTMGYCTSCGTQLDEDSAFCHSCGAPVVNVEDTAQIGSRSRSASASASSKLPVNSTAVMPIPSSSINSAGKAVSSATYASSPMTASAQPAVSARHTGIIIGAIVAALAIVFIIVLVIVPRTQAHATHSISYETDGGTTIATTQVDEGELVMSPANPTKDGYAFEGWYSDSGLMQQVTFPLTAEKDMVLFAKWSEKSDPEADNTSSANSVDINVNVPGANGGTSGGYSGNTSSGSTVTLSVVGSDGSVRTASIYRRGSSQRVLPDGNSRRYSASELASLSDAERCIAWNEIIAASNGYVFKNSGLASYFDSCSWYHRNYNASAGGSLSADAQANVDLLQSMTDSWWMHLATN